jgi:hypothetical protein
MSTKAETDRVELPQGTLDLLILRTLRVGPAHGHAIAKTIERNSDDILQVEQGSLYPALHRLIKRRWIAVEDGVSENTAGRSSIVSRPRAANSSMWRRASGTDSRTRSHESFGRQ